VGVGRATQDRRSLDRGTVGDSQTAQGPLPLLGLLADGQVLSGVIVKETDQAYEVPANLLITDEITTIAKAEVDAAVPSRVSAMPEGLVNVLTRQEIIDLVSFLDAGGFDLPHHLQHHGHRKVE
jgi:hypothetical protein